MPLVPGNCAHHLSWQLRDSLLPRPHPPRHSASTQGMEHCHSTESSLPRIQSIKVHKNGDGWTVDMPLPGSPVVVFVNSKSGDGRGDRFLRRFKQVLNPAQVFDLNARGPRFG